MSNSGVRAIERHLFLLPTMAERPAWLNRLGPGLITGASDDDPSGIATYSQAGAQFGLGMLWTAVLTLPLMIAVQLISARIGRVTGNGLAANLQRIFPRWMVLLLVGLLFIANTVNIGADIAAMGAAAQLVLGWNERIMTVGFGLLSLGLQIFVPYHRYVRILKILTWVLLTYVGVIFTVHIHWMDVAARIVWPQLVLNGSSMLVIVAVFGTTISPYMFFWQCAEEVEDEKSNKTGPLLADPGQASSELDRIRWDTVFGMTFSNLIAFFIILTTAVTLFATGKTDIQTSAQAAQALEPIAGHLAFTLFSMGIIGTGLLSVPVMAGASAYAIAESRGWRVGLENKPQDAIGFYGVIGAGMLLSMGMVFSSIDPIKALFWSAVINGVATAPILAAMMMVASRKEILGDFIATRTQQIIGWTATGVMAAAIVGMLMLVF